MSWALIKTLLFKDPWIIFFTAFMGTLSLLTAPFDKGGNKQCKLARIWARILLVGMGLKVRVEGKEKIDPTKSYIFVSNHLSYADTPVVLGNIPANFRFMAKSGLFKIPLMGHHLRTASHIPVSLENPREAVRSLIEASRLIREHDISVLVFPEGGRTEGVLDPFKEGAAYVAIKAGLPIIPMALIGTREAMPMHGIAIRGGDVTIRIGDPISTEGLTTRDREALTHRLREAVAELLGTPVTAYTQPL
jgi:1-acyl-sn-glycerol-3-phosphate acyltransferase